MPGEDEECENFQNKLGIVAVSWRALEAFGLSRRKDWHIGVRTTGLCLRYSSIYRADNTHHHPANLPEIPMLNFPKQEMQACLPEL